MVETNSGDKSSPSPAKKEKAPEFNPRWQGYLFIALTSLVNIASISNVPSEARQSYWAATMTFGLFTLILSILVLIQDRSQKCLDVFHYTKAYDGYFEGFTLLITVAWWIVGTAYTTHADGIAYVANNIYYSSWLALFSCVYTLNEWSASKDILSIAELTGLSATLKSWWVLFISSLVVLGTSIDLNVRLSGKDSDDLAFAVALGVMSTLLSAFFILVHYDFFPKFEEGGWMELSASFFLILLWTLGLAILTRDQGIAATMSGNQCYRDDKEITLDGPNCTIIVNDVDQDGNPQQRAFPCDYLPRQVPGSNLYFSSWFCFFASLNIAFRWKAAQALQFAQTQQERTQQRLQEGIPTEGDQSQSDDDDEEDM